MHTRAFALTFLLVPSLAACSSGGDARTAVANADSMRAPRGAPNEHVDRIGRSRTESSQPRARTFAVATDAGAADSDLPIPAKYQAFAAAFEAEMNENGAPGAAVALLEHGEVTFAHGFGVKGPFSTEPVDARTLFRYGSLNKALTATAILELVDEQKLSIDDTVASLIPGVRLEGPYGDRITVSDILSHQSDLFDFTNYSLNPALSAMIGCATGPAALHEFVTGDLFAASEYSLAPPETSWLYSNPNYVLAGSVLESLGDGYYADEMQRRVFGPLGMTRTFFDANQVYADGDYTDGLSTGDDGGVWDVAPDAYDCEWLRPAGLGFTSVLDYAKFVSFLYKGDPSVLSNESLALMESQIINTYMYGDNDAYGYGVEVKAGEVTLPSGFYHARVFTHEGAIAGFTSEFFLFPETGFGFIAFTNTDDAFYETSFFEALRSFSGLAAPSPMPVEYTADAGTSPRYAGTFEDTSGLLGTFTVEDRDGAFSIRIPVLDALGIVYESALQSYVEYSFIVTIDSVPDSAASTLQAAVFAPVFLLSFQPGPNGAFDWISINGGLAAKRVRN